MPQKNLQNIDLHALNEKGWLKPPILIYFNLALLSKGLIILILSLVSFGSGSSILESIYPETQTFYISLALSVIPMTTLVMFSIGELDKMLSIKKGLLFLCSITLIIEFYFLISPLLEMKEPFLSPIFFVAIGYVIFLLFTASSNNCVLFLRQYVEGRGVLQKSE